jgi:hypothetical protein
LQNFDEFLTILGDKVRLKGFDKYKVSHLPVTELIQNMRKL